jgi:hypothetical protein
MEVARSKVKIEIVTLLLCLDLPQITRDIERLIWRVGWMMTEMEIQNY